MVGTRRLARCVACLVLGAGLLAVPASVVAVGAEVGCRAETAGGGEACFTQSGKPRYDVSVPLTAELPLPGPPDCTDLPPGYGASGSVHNTSVDTLYVTQGPCAAELSAPIAVIPPGARRELPARVDRHQIHAVHACGPGQRLDIAIRACVPNGF